jgi:outer membrane protein assembly factor BamB
MKQFIGLLVVLFFSAVASAENWPSWRGPHQNGVGPKGPFPTTWSADSNIAWKIKLPGRGSSTPVVWDKNIVLTTTENGANLTLCLDRSGKEKWRSETGKAAAGKHKKASGSNSSPITDGKHIYVYFKSGDLACVDFNGKIVWQLNIQEKYGADTLWWDLGTSPVLTKNYVVIAVMQTGPSYLLALNKNTGTLAWQQERNLDAPLEAAQSYSTPVVTTINNKESIVVLGADFVTAHDAKSGKELWRVGTLNPNGEKYWRSIASPAISNGILLAPYARGKTLTAIDLNAATPTVCWTVDNICADVPTPIAINNKAILTTDRGLVTQIDIKTGKTTWQTELEKNRLAFSASPILAGAHVYLTREDGTTFVVNADTGKVVAKNVLPEAFAVATPVFVDGKILIRTSQELYCVGK